MSESGPIPNDGLQKAHPSYPIIACAMREVDMWGPKGVDLDGNEALFIVFYLSQSVDREDRIGLDEENYNLAEKSFEWLREEGLIELRHDGPRRNATLTSKGLDFMRSIPAFRQFQQARRPHMKEVLIPILDWELSRRLGPSFLSWFQEHRSQGE
jgi:hypothetical protein